MWAAASAAKTKLASLALQGGGAHGLAPSLKVTVDPNICAEKPEIKGRDKYAPSSCAFRSQFLIALQQILNRAWKGWFDPTSAHH